MSPVEMLNRPARTVPPIGGSGRRIRLRLIALTTATLAAMLTGACGTIPPGTGEPLAALTEPFHKSPPVDDPAPPENPTGPIPCDYDWQCVRANPCVAGYCQGHECRYYVRTGASCDDGNPCTENDRCVYTSCMGQPLDCSDGDPCTNDHCTAGQCHHSPNTGATCAGDGDYCTDDVCNQGVCTHPPNTGSTCTDDGDPCTADTCAAGVCTHPPKDCTEEIVVDACTTNVWCEPGVGCRRNWTCDDGDPCTVDICVQSEGTCINYEKWPPLDPEDDCATYGCYITMQVSDYLKFNNDDDNGNEIPDYLDDGPMSAEDDLAAVLLNLSGCAGDPRGSCTPTHWSLRGLYGPSLTHRFYLAADKDGALGGGNHPFPIPGLVYVEAVDPTSPCGCPFDLGLHEEYPSYPWFTLCCKARSEPVPVVEVSELEWRKAAADNPGLSRCPNNGGQRIFPGKISPDDVLATIRKKVKLVATVDPPIAGVTVYFRVWDVDDPFDQLNATMPDVNLIDDDNDGPDNRPTGCEGVWSGLNSTDENGQAIKTFTVSMQPGNNYRAAASCLNDALDQVSQADADALSVELDPATQTYIGNGNFSGYHVPVVWSKMLTVWRKLHVETDSMVRPAFAENTYTTQWAYPTQGDTADRVELKVNDPWFAFDTADGQFDEGWIELSGDAGIVVGHIFEYNSSAGWDEIIVTITAANGLNGQRGLAGLGGMAGGGCVLSDDDLGNEVVFKARTWGCDNGYASVGVLTPPDLEALGLRYGPAYIFPAHEATVSGTGGLTTFLRNIDFGFPNYGKVLWDQAKAPGVRDLPIATPEYWTVMVVSAWQAEEGKDGDPNTETLTNGINTHDDGETSSDLGASYTGICAIFKALMIGESDIPERYTVAHEIGHTLGCPHTSSGLMFPAESVGAPAQQSEPFSADSLVRLRQYSGP